MRERRAAYRVLVGKLTGKKRPFEDTSMDKRIILKWIFKKWDGGHGLDRSDSREGHVAGSCKCSNEPLGSIKCREFPD